MADADGLAVLFELASSCAGPKLWGGAVGGGCWDPGCCGGVLGPWGLRVGVGTLEAVGGCCDPGYCGDDVVTLGAVGACLDPVCCEGVGALGAVGGGTLGAVGVLGPWML